MKVLLFVVLLCWVAFSHINIYLFFFMLLFYLLPYLDGKEHNGDRRLDSVRRFSLWKKWFSPVRYTFADEMQLSNPVRRIYIMVPGDTMEALVWIMGLHGGALDASFSEKLTYVMPRLLLRIPVLRDFLLATGAVCVKDSLESLLMELLNSGRSVCFCPSGFANSTLLSSDADEENTIQTTGIPDSLLSFARQERLELVPVVVHGERKRYSILKWPRVQRFFYQWLQYPFPVWVMPRFWAHQRPAPLQVMFGAVIHCEKYESNERLLQHFCQWVKKSACSGDSQIGFQ